MKKISINEAINNIIEQAVMTPPVVRPSIPVRPSVRPVAERPMPVAERPMPFGLEGFLPRTPPANVPVPIARNVPSTPVNAVTSTNIGVSPSVVSNQMKPGILSGLRTAAPQSAAVTPVVNTPTTDTVAGLAGPGTVMPSTTPNTINVIATNAAAPNAGTASATSSALAPAPAAATSPATNKSSLTSVATAVANAVPTIVRAITKPIKSKDEEDLPNDKDIPKGVKELIDLIQGIRGEFEVGKSTPTRIDTGRGRRGGQEEQEDPSDRFLWSRWLRMPRSEQMNFRVENKTQNDISMFIKEDLKKKVKKAVDKFLNSKEGKEIKNKYNK